MNCETIQEQLLQCEEPSRPPAGLVRHLTQCAACRAFRQQVLEMEDGLRRLPVPVSQLRDRLVTRLQEGELPTPAARPSPWRPSLKERAQQKLALALTLAATLGLFALGWAFWPHRLPDVERKRAEYQQFVQRATTPIERVRQTIAFARQVEADVLREAGRKSSVDLTALAGFYVELVEQKLPAGVKELSPGERADVVPDLLEQLERSESLVSRAIARHGRSPEGLPRMARAARVGQVRLRALLG